jgi:hypothetical protein
MCGRIVQSSGPLRLSIVDGLDVSDGRLGNVPRRYNAAPSQEWSPGSRDVVAIVQISRSHCAAKRHA